MQVLTSILMEKVDKIESRSAALCIAYFMKYHGMSVDDAFQVCRS
jgi:hypothetical protein